MKFQLLERGFIIASLPYLEMKQISTFLKKEVSDIKEFVDEINSKAKNDISARFKTLFTPDAMKIWLEGKKRSQVKKKNNVAGYREDLKRFFRSKMEANLARVLSIEYPDKWEYESEWFALTPNKKGYGGNYLPDFVIRKDDGTIDFVIEVKGYFFRGDKSKMMKMHREHPNTKVVIMTKRTSKQVLDLADKCGMECWLYEELHEKYIDKVNWE